MILSFGGGRFPNTEQCAVSQGVFQKIASDATWTKKQNAIKIPLKLHWIEQSSVDFQFFILNVIF